MLKKLDNKKILNEINENGFSIIENYFDKPDLKIIEQNLLDTLNYIDFDTEKDLKKKYFKIKKENPKLKGKWYDISAFNIDMLRFLHSETIINLVKEFFKTNVVFSGRPAIHVHDGDNDFLLEAHQETKQYARDFFLFWSPLWDTNPESGGLALYKNSHKSGYFVHSTDNDLGNKKAWTKQYTHIIDKNVLSKFEKINLEIKSGSAVLLHSACIHEGYPMSNKDGLRIVMTERFNPLKKIPYLKDENAPLKIPYTGVDYNSIKD